MRGKTRINKNKIKIRLNTTNGNKGNTNTGKAWKEGKKQPLSGPENESKESIG
jgi:hypothetical protein